jgi:RsmE family RNA methyltransferase
MNLVLLHNEDFVGTARVRLSDRRFVHIRNILSAEQGQPLQVGLLGGKLGIGTVSVLTQDAVELTVVLEHEPPQPLPATLIMALPRPKVLKRVLLGVTAMGVKRIILTNSWRVDKSYWHSPLLTPEILHMQLLLGLEQARDTLLPKVEIQQRFKPFVEDVLPSIAKNTCALVAHPHAARACPANLRQAVTLAIGPEGGFTPYEIGKLEEAGLQAVHLGPRPLRFETAAPALLGRLQFCP